MLTYEVAQLIMVSIILDEKKDNKKIKSHDIKY